MMRNVTTPVEEGQPGNGAKAPLPSQPARPAGKPVSELALAPEPEPKVVKLNRIVVGTRIRKAMGDLGELIASILAFGILVPLLVRRMKDNSGRFELVDGARRLKACRDLGLTTVPVRVVELERLVDGEIDVTVLHESFTVSERVSIGLMVESDLGERRGRPKKEGASEGKGKSDKPIAWKRAGFGNQETYRQAKSVVASGNADLIAKMDSGELSINAAYNSLKGKTDKEQHKADKVNAEGDGKASVQEPAANGDSGRKRTDGPFPSSRTKSPDAATPDEGSKNGDPLKVPPYTQAMTNIHQCLQEHGAFDLKPKVVDGALCLPAENPRLALIVAVFKIENLAKLIEEGKLTLKVANK